MRVSTVFFCHLLGLNKLSFTFSFRTGEVISFQDPSANNSLSMYIKDNLTKDRHVECTSLSCSLLVSLCCIEKLRK